MQKFSHIVSVLDLQSRGKISEYNCLFKLFKPNRKIVFYITSTMEDLHERSAGDMNELMLY